VTAATITSQNNIAVFDQYVIPNYTRYPITLVRGEGSHVWDAEGNRYLDLFPGWGCNILGYCPPGVVRAIQEQVSRLIHVPNTWYTEAQGEFARLLHAHGFGKAFFCNSGAEAVEGAIKLARLATPENRYKIITFHNSFHGRTLGALTATAQPKYHAGLGPLVAGFSYAPFNDLDAVESLIDDETCGILIEPIQGEGGVNIAADDFLAGLRQLADERGLMLIFDEVQTGMGRTGTWFAYQSFSRDSKSSERSAPPMPRSSPQSLRVAAKQGVEPDIMTLAKGLAGGVACGALIATDEVATALKPGTHASTFGGNPLAMAAGIATIRTIEEDDLLTNCTEMSDRFVGHIAELQEELSIIEDVRIRGMMIGIDLAIPATPAVKKCMDRGVLVNATHDTVVRLLPAINITAEQVDDGCAVIADVLREMAAEA
jgi:acetylornithine/succinyldiaminopimelate/putrescine aminotransferase